MNPGPMSKRVLLVEDEPTIAVTLGDDLVDGGYAVTRVDDGRRAVELLGSQTFGAVITDLRLPGAGGLEVARAARRACVGRILLISAFVLPEAAAAVDAVLAKPFANERVLEWLRVGVSRGEPG
jgi:CheY-like chemotaxis protein